MRICIKKSRLLPVIGVILFIISAVFFLRAVSLSRLLSSQSESERWKGESKTEFCQLSVFMPENEKKSLEDIYAFRSKLSEALHGASLDTEDDYEPCIDAWCAFGQIKAGSEKAHGVFSVTAAGGNFFDFHPLCLISGSYFSPDDLMHDRILLDEESAWLLYGGTELTGLSVNISGHDFVIAGVFHREDDKFSKAAYDSVMGIYMSYDAFVELNGEEVQKAQEISCYEIVMPQPVKNFAYGAVSDRFPNESGEIVNNSSRFSLIESVKRLKNLSQRSMQKTAISYPYWENAARAVEDRCTLMYTLSLIFAVIPMLLLISRIIRFARRLGRKVTEEIAPAVAEKAQETIRVRQRRRWEKRQEKNNKR